MPRGGTFTLGNARLPFGVVDSYEGGGFPLPGPALYLPVVVGEEAKALALAEYLLQAGLFCRAIRPPTVPEHTCRLRLTVSAQHSDAQVDHLLDALAAGVAHLGLDVDPS